MLGYYTSVRCEKWGAPRLSLLSPAHGNKTLIIQLKGDFNNHPTAGGALAAKERGKLLLSVGSVDEGICDIDLYSTLGR